MPQTTSDSFDEDPDDEYVSEPSFDEDADVVLCPYCKAEMHVLADVCPKCRNFVSREDAPTPSKPLWWILVVLVLILSIIGLGVFL